MEHLASDFSLRPALANDWNFVEALYNAPHVAPWAPGPTKERYLASIHESGSFNTIVQRKGAPFGNMLFGTGPAWLLQIWTIAVLEPGLGAGRFALQYAIERGFRQLHVHRIFLEIVETNEVSRGLCESLGFRVEGCYRDGYHSEQTGYQNLIPYGLLASDKRPTQGKLTYRP